MQRVAIIPARSGSKGLKDKNIIPLGGKPLLAYTVEAAVQSRLFQEVFVSTDSVEYGQIARSFGADIMYRGESLSSDSASTFVVVQDLLGRLSTSPDYFVLLQPTSPLRNAEHIRQSCMLFESRIADFDFLVSVKEAEHAGILVHPLGSDGSMCHFDTDYSAYKRQSYKEYSPNGAIFIGKPTPYLTQKHFFGPRSLAYPMSKISSIDIDDSLDLMLAEAALKQYAGAGSVL